MTGISPDNLKKNESQKAFPERVAGAQFEGDLGEILALGAEISPYIGLREVGVSLKKNMFFCFHLVSTPLTSFAVSLVPLHLITFSFNVNYSPTLTCPSVILLFCYSVFVILLPFHFCSIS